MEQRKRILIFLTFFVCTACLALLTASLATHRWIVAHPLRTIVLNNSTSTFIFADHHHHNQPNKDNDYNDEEDQELPKKFRGEIYFGLFQGTKVLNYGLGDRTTIIWLKQEMTRNPNLMSFSLWFFTILSVSIAMIFGLVGAIFAIINTVMTPIETITGVQGLFLWNGLASFFCACAGLAWFFQYLKSLRENVLTEEEQHHGWTSTNRTGLGYSYFFVLIACGMHFANLVLILMATKSGKRRTPRTVIDKHPEGLIMLY